MVLYSNLAPRTGNSVSFDQNVLCARFLSLSLSVYYSRTNFSSQCVILQTLLFLPFFPQYLTPASLDLASTLFTAI